MEEPIKNRKSLDEIFNDSSTDVPEKPYMTVGEYFQKQEDQKSFIEKHHLDDHINILFYILLIVFSIIILYIAYKIIILLSKLYSKLERWLDKDKIENKLAN